MLASVRTNDGRPTVGTMIERDGNRADSSAVDFTAAEPFPRLRPTAVAD